MSVTYISDVQHVGKPGKSDVGAVRGELREIDLAQVIACACSAEGRGHGITTLGAGPGWYSDRHERVNAIAKASPRVRYAYVAHHINASTGDAAYSMFGYDARSSGGRALAESIAKAVCDEFPGRDVRTIACNPADWTGNMYNTVKGIYAGPGNISGVCSEPLFIDELVGLSPDHRDALLRRYGAAHARGIAAWAAGG